MPATARKFYIVSFGAEFIPMCSWYIFITEIENRNIESMRPHAYNNNIIE